MKIFTSRTQRIGELAENLASRYLVDDGFVILERNYTLRHGEIDIIAHKDGITHFIEVKSVSRENKMLRPEDQMGTLKLARLSRTVSSYLGEHNVDSWQFDVMCLVLNHQSKRASIRMLKNLTLLEN